MSIGRKQRTKEADWTAAITDISAGRYDFAHLDQLIESTVIDIQQIMTNKRQAFGWSGGKDSVALAHIMKLAGITRCIFVMTNLEYPAFLEWVTENMPDGLEVMNTGQDLRWLSAHLNMLFPQDAQTAARWFREVQHKGQAAYYHKHQLSCLAYGRRRADGNFVGREGRNLYMDHRRFMFKYSPLADWTHEDVLALIHREQLKLPPIYSWPRGYQVGTGPWPARQFTGSIQNGWREVFSIDPAIVHEAAPLIPSAAEFLKGM